MAADWVVKLAGQEIHQHVRRALEAGHSWEEIGQALEKRLVDGRTVAEASYERVAGRPADWSFGGPWRCPACGRVISDRGRTKATPTTTSPAKSPTARDSQTNSTAGAAANPVAAEALEQFLSRSDPARSSNERDG